MQRTRWLAAAGAVASLSGAIAVYESGSNNPTPSQGDFSIKGSDESPGGGSGTGGSPGGDSGTGGSPGGGGGTLNGAATGAGDGGTDGAYTGGSSDDHGIQLSSENLEILKAQCATIAEQYAEGRNLINIVLMGGAVKAGEVCAAVKKQPKIGEMFQYDETSRALQDGTMKLSVLAGLSGDQIDQIEKEYFHDDEQGLAAYISAQGTNAGDNAGAVSGSAGCGQQFIKDCDGTPSREQVGNPALGKDEKPAAKPQ